MTQEEQIEAITLRARKNFSKGFNCAECVVEAVVNLVETGLPKDIQKLATGFGGGVGLYGDSCGAISGAVLAVGAVHGRSALPEGDPKEASKKAAQELYGKPGLYRLFNQIPNRIKDKFGSTLCRDITLPWKENWLCRDHALHCREIITESAKIAAELILSDKTELASQPFGANVENMVDAPEACSIKG
jgi:C_GCAxxG_C_C family probable redox protein